MAAAEEIVLPPIKLMEEDEFLAKLNEYFEETFKDQLKDPEFKVLDKAQTKAMMQEVIHNIWFADVEKEEDRTAMKAKEEIKDEVFDPYFDAMEKAEEEKEPITIESAKECVIRRAIDISMVKTRLATAI